MSRAYYIHAINPCDSAEHQDTVREGFRYGLWCYPQPAASPGLYEFQSRTMSDASALRSRLETRA